MEIENETTPAHQIANNRIKKGLKHKIPSILELKKGTLNDGQIGFLLENLDPEKWMMKFVNFGIVLLLKCN